MAKEINEALKLFFNGQLLAWRAARAGTLWKAGTKYGIGTFIKPLNSPTRYPEYRVFFDVLESEISRILQQAGKCHILDVGSPKLFSLLLARENPVSLVCTDVWDVALKEAQSLAGGLSMAVAENLDFRVLDIRDSFDEDVVPASGFDIIYAMSVIEHIEPDPGGDTMALANIIRHTKPGGSIVLSLPVDSHSRSDFKDRAIYKSNADHGSAFFQRVYDLQALTKLWAHFQNDVQLEECVLIEWPYSTAFTRFWSLKGSVTRGILGPVFPFMAPGFKTSHYRNLPEIKSWGDIVLKFRKPIT